MAHRLLSDPDADGWERSDFPIVCETCLGPNPYVRMQRMEYGGECHISGRPYTVFRWRPGSEARYKKTIVCQEVAKAKNVCQVCLLDLDYNLPVQVRDQALGMEDDNLPQSDVGKEYRLNQMAPDGVLDSSFAKALPNETIMRLQRTTPYYKRNRAPVCSFFVKGECKRGAECPYRHEMPTTGELAQQNIKDRYYGTNDPVARKMLNRQDQLPKLVPPDDPNITTLYVGGISPATTEAEVREPFYAHGEVQSVRVLGARHCAFVTFASRKDAEQAADALQNALIIKGQRAKVMWGRPQGQPHDSAPAQVPPHMQPSQVQGGGQPMPPPMSGAGSSQNTFNLPQGVNLQQQPYPAAPPYYASMDPMAQGTHFPSEMAKRPAPPPPAGAAPPVGGEGKRPRTEMPPPVRPPMPSAPSSVPQGQWQSNVQLQGPGPGPQPVA